MIEIAKDALTIENKVEEKGVGYLRFCSIKQIKSMCLAVKILKSSFEINPLLQDKYPHYYRKFMKIVGPHIEKVTDSNVSIHMKRNILQKGEVCKRLLFTLLDANIPFTTVNDVDETKIIGRLTSIFRFRYYYNLVMNGHGTSHRLSRLSNNDLLST